MRREVRAELNELTAAFGVKLNFTAVTRMVRFAPAAAPGDSTRQGRGGRATATLRGHCVNASNTKQESIMQLVQSVHEVQQRAAQLYRPVVDDILRTGSRDAHYIEHTLDRLLDFCGFEPVLVMYKQLCRHYWDIDPEATVDYVNAYREYWDSDEQVDTESGGRMGDLERDR